MSVADQNTWKQANTVICSAFGALLEVWHAIIQGAQWLSGRVIDSRPKGRGFEPHRRHCVVSLSKNINPSLELVQPRKTRPFIPERFLMGRKESNQTKTNKMPLYTRWINTVVCLMAILTDKAAHVINQLANCIKIMVTHRIYINNRHICKHQLVLNATCRPPCIYSKFCILFFVIKTNQHFIFYCRISFHASRGQQRCQNLLNRISTLSHRKCRQRRSVVLSVIYSL